MTSSAIELNVPLATNVVVTDDTLTVDLSDGRTISVPLAWYPRLIHATDEERSIWRLTGRGEGIHWPRLNEDISVVGLIAGRASGESQQSFSRSSFTVHRSFFIVHRSSFIVHRSSFIVHRSSFIVHRSRVPVWRGANP